MIRPTVRSDVVHGWRLSHSMTAHWTGFPRLCLTHRPQLLGQAVPVSAAVPMGGPQPHPLPTVLITRSSFPDLTSWPQPALLLIVP